MLKALARWLQRRMEAEAQPPPRRLCPDCIYMKDANGDVVELIDCQTGQHHLIEPTPDSWGPDDEA